MEMCHCISSLVISKAKYQLHIPRIGGAGCGNILLSIISLILRDIPCLVSPHCTCVSVDEPGSSRTISCSLAAFSRSPFLLEDSLRNRLAIFACVELSLGNG
jgi:hypothetical protein